MRLDVKDHPTFLRAARRVYGELPHCSFLLVGEGERMEALRTLAAELGLMENVYFLGRCERIADVLSVSDVCVLSSKAEGFSNAILESMRAGLPMVVTDVGGNAEAVVDGRTGFVVPPADPAALAEALLLVAEDPALRRRFGEAGRERVTTHFTLDACVAKYRALYDELFASASERAITRAANS